MLGLPKHRNRAVLSTVQQGRCLGVTTQMTLFILKLSLQAGPAHIPPATFLNRNLSCLGRFGCLTGS